MATFKGAILTCVQCGSEFRVPQCRAATATTCSHACAVVQRAINIQRKATVKCRGCGETFEVPRCHVERRRYCSRVCQNACPIYRETLAATRRGKDNPAWVGGIVAHSDGYIYEKAEDHPFAGNGYILQHRRLMERWLIENKPRSKYLVKVNGKPYLSPEFVVHHKDEVKDHNDLTNLQCMTKAEHTAHHSTERAKARKLRGNDHGQFD